MELNQSTLLIIGVVFLLLFFYFIPLGLWFQAKFSGIRISLIELTFMRFRKVPPGIIINAMIALVKEEIYVDKNLLEAYYLAGGNVLNVVNVLIEAKESGLNLSFKEAAKLDMDKNKIN